MINPGIVRRIVGISCALVVVVLGGCNRNPQVAKQRYLDKGTAYFQKGKYREAAIEDQNAIQIDSQFAPAHYQLAQCYLKLSDWARAYQELMRTVDLDPGNSKAQLDITNLLLG